MAEENKDSFSSKLDFGIQNTREISGDDLFDQMETITGDPDKVKKIEADKSKEEKKDVKKKPGETGDETPDDEKETGKENPSILDVLDDESDETKKEKNPPTDPTSKDDKGKEAPEDGKGDEANKGDDNYFPDIAKELFALGVFTKEEDEEEPKVETGEDFLNLFINEKKKGAIEILEGILAKHGEDKKELFDAIILKGVDPKEYLERYAVIQDLKDIDLAVEDNQERVMREELKAQGWDRADIDAEVEKIKSYGDLESASKRYHKSLVKRNEAQQLADKQRKEHEAEEEQERDTEYRGNITTILNAKLKDKEFDGIPLTPALANKTLDSIYTKKWRLPNGDTITDFDNEILRLKRPENHATKVKIALIMELLKTDPTLSTIKKKAISNESSTLFSNLEKKKVTKADANNKKPEATTSSWFS